MVASAGRAAHARRGNEINVIGELRSKTSQDQCVTTRMQRRIKFKLFVTAAISP